MPVVDLNKAIESIDKRCEGLETLVTKALDKEKAVDGERAWARTASWAGIRSLRPRDTPRRRIGKLFLSQRYKDYGNSTRCDGRHVRAVTCNDVKTCL